MDGTFVEGFVIPVRTENKQAYIDFATATLPYFKKHGALKLVETWEADVPHGEVTSFPMAIDRQPGESIVFSWIVWPDKETRDGAYDKIMAEMEADGFNGPPPFEGKRMIFGGFETIVDS